MKKKWKKTFVTLSAWRIDSGEKIFSRFWCVKWRNNKVSPLDCATCVAFITTKQAKRYCLYILAYSYPGKSFSCYTRKREYLFSIILPLDYFFYGNLHHSFYSLSIDYLRIFKLIRLISFNSNITTNRTVG